MAAAAKNWFVLPGANLATLARLLPVPGFGMSGGLGSSVVPSAPTGAGHGRGSPQAPLLGEQRCLGPFPQGAPGAVFPRAGKAQLQGCCIAGIWGEVWGLQFPAHTSRCRLLPQHLGRAQGCQTPSPAAHGLATTAKSSSHSHGGKGASAKAFSTPLSLGVWGHPWVQLSGCVRPSVRRRARAQGAGTSRG